MTEAMENQEIIFRKKLKNRRAKFDRKIVRNRLLVKDRLTTDSIHLINVLLSTFSCTVLCGTEMTYWRIG